MAHNELDKNLIECRNKLPDHITATMRSRLDETYRMIREMEKQAASLPNKTIKKRKPLQKGLVIAVAAAIVGLFILSPALISPTMAESLNKLPIVGNIFKLAGDFGLQKAEEEGLTTTVNESASHDGFTITATKVSYDGIRVALELTRTAPEGTKGALYHLRSIMNDTAKKGSFENIQVWLPSGKYGSLSLGTDMVTEPSESVLVQLNELSGDIPDQFDLTVKMGLRGYKQPFELKVPVVKMAGHTVLTSEETKTYDGESLKVAAKMEMTPITTLLTLNIADEYLLQELRFDIVDDQGNFPKWLSGGIDYENHGKVAYTYEAFRTKPKSITVKPYLDRGMQGKQYIPELEFTLPVPENSEDGSK
ncbi:DUF4179 domain-containing protein [Paenibacillus tyrfis]|uniref:DUF4179 domain-containing protein n=1 Tax=Paenibacillus tyrfis TaxID=1501230 RepID=UPI000B5877A6|nr:DUF4179 domain-containing protein [Paenibacillus tyrfis]